MEIVLALPSLNLIFYLEEACARQFSSQKIRRNCTSPCLPKVMRRSSMLDSTSRICYNHLESNFWNYNISMNTHKKIWDKFKEALAIVRNGMRQAFLGCGFSFQKTRHPVELYSWQTMDDEDVCEDCLERASRPAMDIADWIKEGLPRTPEAGTKCGKNCRCELIQAENKTSSPSPI